MELVHSDIYVGEPGLSPMLYGTDFARFKPRCDVLFDASAHSPTGEPVRQMKAGFRLGALAKLIHVNGPRIWRRARNGFEASPPETFVRMPLHYGFAFGGTHHIAQAEQTESLPANPVGMGWAGSLAAEELEGEPIGCLERMDDPIRRPTHAHAAVALSAIPRHWPARAKFAGTYDERWREEVFPFLPKDFDEEFHQCAPADQQIAYPPGAEEVTLLHLMPNRPRVVFNLPRFALTIRVLHHDYRVTTPQTVVDTLFFETDRARFSAVWRACVPIQRKLQEIDTVIVGSVNTERWEKMRVGLDPDGCGCAEADAA